MMNSRDRTGLPREVVGLVTLRVLRRNGSRVLVKIAPAAWRSPLAKQRDPGTRAYVVEGAVARLEIRPPWRSFHSSAGMESSHFSIRPKIRRGRPCVSAFTVYLVEQTDVLIELPGAPVQLTCRDLRRSAQPGPVSRVELWSR